jgi:hypothetical protein
MEITFYMFIIFVCGIVFNMTWGYVLGLGYGINAFKMAMVNSLLLLAKNVQSVMEIHQLKYMSYELLGRDKKYVEFQKEIDRRELNSLKNSLIRDYINTIPAKYNYMIKFHDWDSAMSYLNNLLKE